MHFPDHLQQAIQEETTKLSIKELEYASRELSLRYRNPSFLKPATYFLDTEAQRLAYLTVRMPATFCAISHALKEVQKQLVESTQILSVLDLGAGPGTASWAVAEIFPQLERLTLIEQDLEMITLGKRLARHAESAVLKQATWRTGCLKSLSSFEPHDLSVIAYALGELEESAQTAFVAKAWESTRFLLLVEPGTPKGFAAIRKAREALLKCGAYPVAPCPHSQTCPMKDGNWCHFSARLERSELHRLAKQVTLGFEDEKFSYFCAAKDPISLPRARVLQHPLQRSGHVILSLCRSQGDAAEEVISRKQGLLYKEARKADWGDCLE